MREASKSNKEMFSDASVNLVKIFNFVEIELSKLKISKFKIKINNLLNLHNKKVMKKCCKGVIVKKVVNEFLNAFDVTRRC